MTTGKNFDAELAMLAKKRDEVQQEISRKERELNNLGEEIRKLRVEFSHFDPRLKDVILKDKEISADEIMEGIEYTKRQIIQAEKSLASLQSEERNLTDSIERLKRNKERASITLHIKEILKDKTMLEWVDDTKYGRGKITSAPIQKEQDAIEFLKLVTTYLDNNAGLIKSESQGYFRVVANKEQVINSFADNAKFGGHAFDFSIYFEKLAQKQEEQAHKPPRVR